MFRAYIIQSGAVLCPWGFQKKEELAKYVRQVSVGVACISRNSKNLIECLRSKSAATLVNTNFAFGSIDRAALLNWSPTNEVENDGAFLTDTPLNLINKNAMKDLPFMSGTVSDEGLLITRG